MRAVVLAALMLLSVAVPAQAIEGEVWAFLYAYQPQVQGTYVPAVQAASDDIAAEVTNGDVGDYTVRLTSMGEMGEQGVPMVTAAGVDGVHCQATSFEYRPSDQTEVITVGCYAGAVAIDTGFTLSFFSSTPPDSGVPGAYGYVRNDQPALTDYPGPPGYNSTGGPVVIARTGNGWTVRFHGDAFRNAGGNVQVTALGKVPARCSVVGWRPVDVGVEVDVRCTESTQWTLMYAHDRSVVGNDNGFFGYLQGNEPTSPEYTPNPERNRAPSGFIHTVTRDEPGRYHAQVYGPLTSPVALHVTANGDNDNFCVITGAEVYEGDAQPAGRVDISCFTPEGQPHDNWFSLNYYAPPR